MSALQLDTSINTTQGLKKQNTIRICYVQKKIPDKYRTQRKRLRGLRKNKTKKKEQSYTPGAFSPSIEPDMDFDIAMNDIPITFVSDDVGTFVKLAK